MAKRMTMTRATHEACDFNSGLGRIGSTSLFTRVEAEVKAADLRGQGFKTERVAAILWRLAGEKARTRHRGAADAVKE